MSAQWPVSMAAVRFERMYTIVSSGWKIASRIFAADEMVGNFPDWVTMRAIFVAWYNFGRKHEALDGKTPAMGSKLMDHVWTIKDLIERAAQ